MKKILVLLAVVSCFTMSYAYQKGEKYIAPVIGYHFFDDDHNLDDKIEGGLRYGMFLTDKYALEAEAGYTRTDKDPGNGTDAVSLGLNLVRYFDQFAYVKPYVFGGVAAELYSEDHQGLEGGFGAAYPVRDNLAVDLRLKDMYMTNGRNDVVPSVALNYYFGKPVKAVAVAPAPAPVVVKAAEPAPAPVVAKVAEPAPAPVVAKVAPAPAPAAIAVVKPADTDADGVIDDNDKCPATPKGVTVDSKGCPLDTDADGVLDYLDKCPGTPKGYKVNADGCFVAVTLHINFATNSNKIVGNYNDEMKEFSAFLNANPTLKVEIQGHTDSKGSATYNKKLSQRRADSVVKELSTKYGVDGSRLTAVGYGEEQPIAPNDTPENMFKNRRIDSVVK